MGIALLTAGPERAAASEKPAAELEVAIGGLRNMKGMIRLCLTQDARHFPDCGADPAAIKRSFPAREAGVTLTALVPGRYALSLIHDENGNGKLDTLLAMPKEGFGFSRDPAIRFGPPKFAEVVFDIASGHSRRNIRVRYLL